MPTTLLNAAIVNSHSRIELYGFTSGTIHHAVHIEDGYGITDQVDTPYRRGKYDGMNPYAIKTVSAASGRPAIKGHRYHLADVIATAANPTFTVHLASAAATTFDDEEIWIDIIQPDTTGPLGTEVTSAAANYGLGAAGTLAAGGTWTGTIGTAYQIAKTMSGSVAGVYSVFVNVATTSAKTVYFDPHVDVT